MHEPIDELWQVMAHRQHNVALHAEAQHPTKV